MRSMNDRRPLLLAHGAGRSWQINPNALHHELRPSKKGITRSFLDAIPLTREKTIAA
jgi:hypothetical protein